MANITNSKPRRFSAIACYRILDASSDPWTLICRAPHIDDTRIKEFPIIILQRELHEHVRKQRSGLRTWSSLRSFRSSMDKLWVVFSASTPKHLYSDRSIWTSINKAANTNLKAGKWDALKSREVPMMSLTNCIYRLHTWTARGPSSLRKYCSRNLNRIASVLSYYALYCM
jgi:hypothetical protein